MTKRNAILYFMNSSPKKIGFLAICILIFVAIVMDLLTLIPFIGGFIGAVFWIGVGVFLWSKGFGFFNFRRAAPMVISMVAEIIPAVQALPTILAGTVAIIFIIKVQEKTGLSLNTLSNHPLNQNGTRMPTANLEKPSTNRNVNNQPLIVDGIRAPQK